MITCLSIIIPDQTVHSWNHLLSCLVDITLPYWSWGTMIVLHTQSNKQEQSKSRWTSHKQLLCPSSIRARVVYAFMSWLGWLAACTTLVVTVKADKETMFSTDCCCIDEKRQLLTCILHACDTIQTSIHVFLQVHWSSVCTCIIYYTYILYYTYSNTYERALSARLLLYA